MNLPTRNLCQLPFALMLCFAPMQMGCGDASDFEQAIDVEFDTQELGTGSYVWNAVKDNDHAPIVFDTPAPGMCMIWYIHENEGPVNSTGRAIASGDVAECAEACKRWGNKHRQIQMDVYKSKSVTTRLEDGTASIPNSFTQPYEFECRIDTSIYARCQPITGQAVPLKGAPQASRIKTTGGTICIKN